MEFDMSKTASELLKIADAIEKEASEKTYFVCDECNHTANLASINRIRSKVASESGIEKVSSVTINDNILCPVIDCGGSMHYAATDESDKYYVDVEAGKEEDDPFKDLSTEEDSEDAPDEVTSEPTDESPEGEDAPEDSKFEPVDEQVAPEEKAPEDEGDAEELDEEVVDEEPEPKKKPKKKKDKADDEKAVPKFTEMPEDMKDLKMKSASDRFNMSVARYSNM